MTAQRGNRQSKTFIVIKVMSSGWRCSSKWLRLFDDKLASPRGVSGTCAMKSIQQSLVSELHTVFVCGLGDAVTENQQPIARNELHFPFNILQSGQHA